MDRRSVLWTVAVVVVTGAVISGLIVRQADTDPASEAGPPRLPEPEDSTGEGRPDDSEDPDRSDPEPVDPPDPPEPSAPSEKDPTDGLERFVSEAIAFIEQTRGMPFLEEPTVFAVAGDEFEARIVASLEEDFAEEPERVEEWNAIYRVFGLIQPDERVDEVYRAFGAAQVLGFYDPESAELVVRAAGDLSLLTKSTIVHELTHAFDDQYYDLDRPEYFERTDEIPWTFSAVVEGSASHVQTLWEETLSGGDQIALLQEELSFGDLSILSRFELEFLLLEISPYESGEPFVAGVVGAEGYDALGELLMEPPPTSEQIISAEAFSAGEVGSGVAPPPADGEVIAEGVGGQVLLASLFLGEGVDFGSAAQGWGDDYFVVWDDGDVTCLRWDLEADSEQDLEELSTALQRWVAGSSGRVSRPEPSIVRVDRCV